MRLLRYNGEDRDDRHFYYHAHNFLMDNIRAAFLNVKLKYLPQWLSRRQAIADLYQKGLQGVKQIKLPRFNDRHRTDVFNSYVIRAERRDELKKHLDDNGLVETLVQWDSPVYEEPIMKETKNKLWRFADAGAASLPKTEKICKEVLSLPMYPELSDKEVDYVAAAVRNFYL